MTVKATLIMDELEKALETIAGVDRVYRSLAGLSLPSNAVFPVIRFRPLRNNVDNQLGNEAKVTFEIGIEAIVLADNNDIDADMDDLLYKIRACLNVGDFHPFAKLVRAFSATEPGISLGQAQYMFPQPGGNTASVELILTCRYVERY